MNLIEQNEMQKLKNQLETRNKQLADAKKQINQNNQRRQYTEAVPDMTPKPTISDGALFTQVKGHWDYSMNNSKLEDPAPNDVIPPDCLRSLYNALNGDMSEIRWYIDKCVEQRAKYESDKTLYDFVLNWRMFWDCFKRNIPTKDQERYATKDERGALKLLSTQREIHDSKPEERSSREISFARLFNGIAKNKELTEHQIQRAELTEKIVRIHRKLTNADPSPLDLISMEIWCSTQGITSERDITIYLKQNIGFNPNKYDKEQRGWHQAEGRYYQYES